MATPPSSASSPNGTETTSSSNACLDRWIGVLHSLKAPLTAGLQRLAVASAKRPMWVVSIVSLLSVTLLTVGIATGFNLETDGFQLWTPIGSYPLAHRNWIDDESNFPDIERTFRFIIYREGAENLLAENLAGSAVERVLDVVETIVETEGFDELCALFDRGYCRSESPASFWNHNRSAFYAETQNGTDTDAVIDGLSRLLFPNGEPVQRNTLYGTPIPSLSAAADNSNNEEEDVRLTSALAFHGVVFLPPDETEAMAFESRALDRVLALRDEWTASSESPFRLDVIADRSFDDELSRAVVNDIPLMALALTIMSVFCSVVLMNRRDWVQSQSLLGVGAVLCIVASLATAYGLLFCLQVPFTSLTQVFPFILVGIGLDDAFIITGSYARTDPSKTFEERISAVMEDSGASMFVATFTTFSAFSLGSSTKIPAVRWFCWYAAPTILIDFLYQITFFVALMALDHRRIQANRYDSVPCLKRRRLSSSDAGAATEAEAPHQDNHDEDQDAMEEQQEKEQAPKESFTDRLMARYADFLLRPVTKVIVVIVFAIVLGLGLWRATRLTQAFNFLDMTPSGSYVRGFFDAFDTTSTGESDGAMQATMYFRDVDFSTEETQNAMDAYVNDIVDLEYVSSPPESFWLRDFRQFVSGNNNNITDTVAVNDAAVNLDGMSFEEQIAVFLQTEPYQQLYSRDIVLNDKGVMTASRTYFRYDAVDRFDVKDQTNALLSQREVTRNQPVNQGTNRWHFFTFGYLYNLWEFFDVVVDELTLTTSVSLAAVFLVALLFIPHPAGTLFVTLVVAVVYVELLGVLEIAGLHINSVTSIGLVMSIGLVVDYSMHIVFCYFEIEGVEDRNARVKLVLRTMGSSVFIGGFSTFLGVLPLSLSQSEVFWTFFVDFLGIVSLGLGHGLMLVPVLLSWIGPVRTGGSGASLGVEEAKETVTTTPKLANDEDDAHFEEDK